MMARMGDTIMGERAGPAQVVRDEVRAEEVGVDFLTARARRELRAATA